jgi:drug/metabolite transporter (DMT)-like permease
MRNLYTWGAILAIVLESSIGDVLLSRAMKQIGDLGQMRQLRGLGCVIRTVLTHRTFLLAIFFMTLAFFSLLLALSWADVSLVGPASASLTFVSNALGAKFFLRERVDRRRWAAAVFVASGVAMLAG